MPETEYAVTPISGEEVEPGMVISKEVGAWHRVERLTIKPLIGQPMNPLLVAECSVVEHPRIPTGARWTVWFYRAQWLVRGL